MSFRSQLWSLQRATPRYGADVYDVYGDDDIPDIPDEYDSEGAQVHAFDPLGHSPAAAPGVLGAVARPPSDALGGRSAGAVTAAVRHRRATMFRRRRQVAGTLLLASLAGVAPAVLVAGPWVVAEAVAGTLLVTYVGLLIRRGRHEAERAKKVRYLTPIQAPRPAVVVIGSGAAR
ncbi:MAG TPA: hypothetical protein VFI47_04810 [Acidimicrobiales bacterium]|nr:hypothetical protein [Acidimicrobiales bacterium]